MPAVPFNVMRHAEWSHPTGAGPAPSAEAQISTARDLLVRELGNGAVILSSAAENTMYTANSLATGSNIVVPSVRIQLGGLRVDGIDDFDRFVEVALEEADVELSPESPLIVVTHGPLVDHIAGRRVGYAEPILYTPGTWQKTINYLDIFKEALEQEIASRRG